MIDERFSAASFNALGRSTPTARLLCKALETEIAAELHAVVHATFRRIADRLRELGHDLKEELPDYSAEYAAWHYTFRDFGAYDEKWTDHRLRIHLHTQVSSGYPHFCNATEKESDV
jgi:hypothetical protein